MEHLDWREREDGLAGMEREDSLVLLVPRVSQDYKDYLDYLVTREIVGIRETLDLRVWREVEGCLEKTDHLVLLVSLEKWVLVVFLVQGVSMAYLVLLEFQDLKERLVPREMKDPLDLQDLLV